MDEEELWKPLCILSTSILLIPVKLKLLHRLIESQLSPSIGSEEDSYLSVVLGQFEEAIELLESLEV